MNKKLVRQIVVVVAVLAAAQFAQASVIVKEWSFNTLGDKEGWTGANLSTPALTVAAAISGTEIVLQGATGTNTDPRILYPNTEPAIPLPGWATTWESFVIRVRQLDAKPDVSGVASQAWNATGTLLAINSNSTTVIPNNNITQGGRVTQTTQADNWQIFTINLVGFSNTVFDAASSSLSTITSIRFDPIGGTGSENKGFEVDYIRLTAIPEPGTVGLVVAGLFLAALRRRHMRV